MIMHTLYTCTCKNENTALYVSPSFPVMNFYIVSAFSSYYRYYVNEIDLHNNISADHLPVLLFTDTVLVCSVENKT